MRCRRRAAAPPWPSAARRVLPLLRRIMHRQLHAGLEAALPARGGSNSRQAHARRQRPRCSRRIILASAIGWITHAAAAAATPRETSLRAELRPAQHALWRDASAPAPPQLLLFAPRRQMWAAREGRRRRLLAASVKSATARAADAAEGRGAPHADWRSARGEAAAEALSATCPGRGGSSCDLYLHHALIPLRLLHLCISHLALRSDHTRASLFAARATTRARSRARRATPDRTFTPRIGAAAACCALATASALLASPPAAGPQPEQCTAYASVTSVSLLRVLCPAPVTARAAFLRGTAATEGHGSACAALGWLRLRPLAAGLG
ncbi:hypothetical protein FA09DRAFT_223676 [Tilletiopsis washingtonensis]|jgi:hypothetical protein|uniref:Uncharacterized protein n=1 Tax=Tilletiopsis washingtonensis TaxID=58919 RepID=A0A316ZDY3_9BASI|nr:hypothetical protein FA09DRAFT_223676 [Tilletiopsis washingtonensis]PWN99244.1 hypothetical protein FA09DRAFT_223676 [Tilletiopsis washingtonensis]